MAKSDVIWDFNIQMGRDVVANEMTVDGLLAALEKACLSRDAMLVCHLSRELVKAVILSRDSSIWNPVRLVRCRRALSGVMPVAAGTVYERNCSRRVSDFENALTLLLEEEEACAPLRKAFA
jgi:hypothetical protein